MSEELVVSTRQGRLIGIKNRTAFYGTHYYSFSGIPYAQPPVKSLQFRPPKPAGKWKGIYDATKEKSDCIQYSYLYKTIVGSQDCLYLNVHTPQPPSKITEPTAVLVLIHLGGNYWGSGSKHCFGNPDFVISHDVVVVTFNYRLHALGFLNLGIPECSGNMGLKDQVLALKWIKENIKSFGGDPNNVTLVGGSSAASNIHFHMMSPLSKGLFHKVIMQCGYGLNSNWSYITHEESFRRAFLLGKELGYEGNDPHKLYRFLRTLEPKTLTEAVGKVSNVLKKENPEKYEGPVFLPSVETCGKDALLTNDPRDLMYTVESIPMICSIAQKEGLVAFCTNPYETCGKNLSKVVKEALWMYKMDDNTLKNVTQQIRSFYFGDKEINEEVIENLVNMYTDLWYRDWYDMLDYMATQSPAQPVYVYEFSFCGEYNYQRLAYAPNAPDWFVGACHAEDTSYFIYYQIVMNVVRRHPTDFGVRESKVVRNLSTLLTNFAKTGNPNGETIKEIHWKPHHPDNPSYLHIDEKLDVMNGRIREENVQFWRKLLKYIRENETRISSET